MQKYLWKYFLVGHTQLQQLSIVTKSWLWPSNYWLSCKARTILFWFGFICKWTERLFCFKWHFKGSSINDVRHTLYPLPLMAYSSYLVTILMTPFPKILTSLKYDPLPGSRMNFSSWNCGRNFLNHPLKSVKCPFDEIRLIKSASWRHGDRKSEPNSKNWMH